MSHVFHRQLRRTYPTAVRGEGPYLYDAAGKRYIDGSGGAAVSCLGHSHPAVIAAIKAQLDKLPYVSNSFFTTEPMEQLADALIADAPAGVVSVYYVNDGSEGTEAALKMARQYFLEIGQPKRHRVIARRQSYHGNTLGALSVGGNFARRAPYQPILLDITRHIAPCYAYRDKRDDETEELWARTGEYGQKRDGMLINGAWPKLPESLIDKDAENEVQWAIDLIAETRSTRSELNVPAGAKIPLLLIGADAKTEARLEAYQGLIDRMARLEYSCSAESAPAGSVTFVLDGATVALPLEGVVDLPAEAERLKKEIAKLTGEITKMDAKLNNVEFVKKAPEEVVDELRERRDDASTSSAKLTAALAQISGAA